MYRNIHKQQSDPGKWLNTDYTINATVKFVLKGAQIKEDLRRVPR